ncbi:thiol reductant ABC exporter subunit CydD [Megamonas hypermegale]|uniref:thiol reductant ABC exporter subunit CydD n=1 Tax=Megamonas hypermegale TaxID=158847 RepID=UPI001956E240|nr:thiol reductant ABC exporter subunit CydD [Megamonas hypermegale]MBM6761823.1 thiol reductant ABC exporter subunit CydD [Megamonas hypermegale]
MLDKNILKDIFPYKKSLIFIILSNIIQATMIVSISYIIAYLADKLLFDELNHSAATPFLALLFFFFVVKAVLNYINRLKMEEISLNLQSKLRYKLLQALALDFKSIQRKPKGQWLAIITKGVDKLDVYLTSFIPQFGLLITIPLVLVTFTFINDWISGLIFLFTAPLIPFFMILIGKIADKENKKQWQVFQKLAVYMADLLPGLLVVKAYNQTQRQLKQVEKNGEKFSEATLKVLKIAFISAFMLEFIATISIAIIAVNIGLRLLYGQVSFLPAFFCLLVAPQFYQPFRQFGSAFHEAMNGIVASSEIYKLIQAAPNNKQKNIVLEMEKAPQIIFENVDFSYKNDENVLKDLNFTIKAGSQVVLTGANGAGKSTIFKLLLKLLDVKAGKILVDGKNLYDIDEQSWLNNIGWVAQEPYVFKSSLRENITLGRACSKTQLERVTQLVNLTEFIKKQEHGYDSIVGGAINLSSGQKRRLGLARALLCNPKVLLLDEPMENLDSKNEELIKSVLEKLKGKITVIIIAHRRQTIEAADKIIILDKGTIKEYGSAEELKKTNSYYHQLLNRLEGNLLYDK